MWNLLLSGGPAALLSCTRVSTCGQALADWAPTPLLTTDERERGTVFPSYRWRGWIISDVNFTVVADG